MTPPRRFFLLDVFTHTPMQGNGLAVVLDADGLDDDTMLAFTREMRLSETAFVQSPTREGADYRNRIWDPRRELPMAGHPSLGAAVAVASAAGAARARYVQEIPAGLQRLEVELDGDVASASMLQEPVKFGPILEPGPVLATLGLSEGQAAPRLPVQVVSTGVPQVLAPVADRSALAGASPQWSAVGELLDAHGAIVLYLVHCEPEQGTARARAFAHSAAMGEDPATGSAAGPLCAYLHARTGAERVEIEQGVEMGRPSRLSCAVQGDRVRVAGGVVVMVEGTVRLA